MALTMPQTLDQPSGPTVKPTTPDPRDDKLRRRTGEMRLPMNAIVTRERCGPESTIQAREREAAIGFVEVNFEQGESPLGLVVDWSMALPVISAVLPGSFAADFEEELQPGLVLLAVNRLPVILGAAREEVESNLSIRPLNLLFEAPHPYVFAKHIPVAWQRSGPAAQPFLAAGETGIVDQFATSQQFMNLTTHGGLRKPQPHLSLKSSIAGSSKAGPSKSVSLQNTAEITRFGDNFLEMHPERSPLSRFGNLNVVNPNPFSSDPSKHTMTRSMSDTFANSKQLPQIHRPLASSTISSGFGQSFSGYEKEMATHSRGYEKLAASSGYRRGFRERNKSKHSNKSLTWLAADAPRPDTYYEPLLDADNPSYGAGPAAFWPLGHEDEYVCRLGDMALCSRLREAYEVGFRAQKRDKPTATDKNLGGSGDALRVRRVAKVESIDCDACGAHLAHVDKPGPAWFYYCRRCKRAGKRFELCLQCHALEVLQGEGKYSGRGIHPHYTRCLHASLVRRPSLEAAYPFSPHLFRVLCDLCGHTVVGRGSGFRSNKAPEQRGGRDKSSSAGSANGSLLNPQKQAYVTQNEFYSCTRCPDEIGLRFEICEFCMNSISEHRHGSQRLETFI
eukprot:TRINITY_DN32724_c0_g1_i1.p1 TRINITY_DN32724_c0_g1~~TRINITY_DN32724_c0_g1_i1.p1  ORF type:complete len:626 (+),score=96.01 TRINITY_DN32724_c0_g1_i1:24-1880(+)